MAIMAYLFREYANEDIDISKVILMCLIHDVVEIEAGDTYAYDEEAKKSQREREERAKKHIFGMLPSDQGASWRHCLMSLKLRKLQRLNLQRLWIIYSLYFFTKPMVAEIGRNTELPRSKSCVGRRRLDRAPMSSLK